jgi:serine-type D-Ala-D-Ala carboxypeptidase/endopeptidase (penicillin-binding protein 4)
MLKRIFSIAIAGLMFIAGCAHHDKWLGRDIALDDKLDPVLHRLSVTQSICAARVIELKSGRELYAAEADRPVMPASNGKICVSAAALNFFGPNACAMTYLAQDGDDLWILGSGDPGIGDNDIAKHHGGTTVTVLHEWSAAVKAKGITHVKDIHYWDGAFESRQIHPSWHRGYLTDWYAAPVSGLNFNDNCIDITVEPGEPGQPAKYSIVPPVSEIKVINDTITGGEGAAPAITREQNANVFTLTGHVVKKTKVESKPVTDPGAFFADALRTQLIADGVNVDGKILWADAPLHDQAVPPSDALVAQHATEQSEILRRILRNSQNLFAECDDKMLGHAYFAAKGVDTPGSWAAGSDAVHAYLRAHHVDDKALIVADGSGLSRDNRVTARIITEVLRTVSRSRNFETFRTSLAEPGESGTLGKRIPDLEGHVWAKTGYIGGVRSLSGYVHTKKGQWLAFSFIFNNIGGSVKPYEDIQDAAVRMLYNYKPNIAKGLFDQ